MKLLELTVRYKVPYETDLAIDLSSTIRGLWGRGLRRAYCLQRNVECDKCPFDNCSYYSIFEKKYGEAGHYHPYIIQPLSCISGELKVIFKFIGWACDNPGQIMLSVLNTDGAYIMSKGVRIPLELQSVVGWEGLRLFERNSPEILAPVPRKLVYEPEKADQAILEFDMPLRQKNRGNLMSHFVWNAFASSLKTRVNFLDRFFNKGGLGLPNEVSYEEAKILENSMIWQERYRKSFRQNSAMKIGGLMGKVILERINPEMVGYLKLGSFLHSGKQCSFGNGHYTLELSKKKISPGIARDI